MKTVLALFTLLIGITAPATAQEAMDLTPLKKWVEEVRSVNSLAATFKQSRSVLNLRAPSETTGNLWYQKPNKFRWELGSPPRTIVIHSGQQLVVMDTKEKEAQILDTTVESNRKEIGAYFDLVFPQSWEEFESKLLVNSMTPQGNLLEIDLEPRDPSSAPGLKSLKLSLDPKTNFLQGFVINRKDAGFIRVDFTKYTRNIYLPSTQFKAVLEGYAVKKG